MNKLKLRLILAASAAALLSACVTGGVPGFGDAGGCRTVYVLTGGGIQPINSCGATPREDMMAQRMIAPQSVEEVDPDAPPPVVVTPVSAAAKATQPYVKPAAYASPNAMIEAADMNAFMQRVRTDYANGRNHGAWGYVVVDALAADDPALAQAAIDALQGHEAPDWMSANHLRPWVLAANGQAEEAATEMLKLRRVLPSGTLRGHRALLAEGVGDHAGALAIYDERPATFSAPNPADIGSMEYFVQARAFSNERLLALRQAELLRALNRDEEASALLARLLAVSPQADPYVEKELGKITKGEGRRAPLSLKQAMSVALGDEADLIEREEAFVQARGGRGSRAPFNHLMSSIRQSALLLDPDNGDVRVTEAAKLYEQGKFEPALRIAQIGNPIKERAALLQSTAGLAALQLGSPDTLQAMVERSLRIDDSPEARLQAAGTLITANRTDRALQLVDQVLREKTLDTPQKVYALLTRSQAYSQAGDMARAVAAAREARALEDDESTQQFLASLLVDTAERDEGLTLMRHHLAADPENTGQMNNFGYALIDGHRSNEELDEGFRLLKQAIRLTPDEPNLLDSIGWAYYQYGDFREANRFIEMALKAFAPFGHWELSDHMGDIKWRLGEPDAAREHWREALTAYPPKSNAKTIEAKIRDGLTTPAPVRRDTPEVPLNRGDGGIADI